MQKIMIHGLGQTSSDWDAVKKFLPVSEKISCPDLYTLIQDKSMTYDSIYQGFSNYCNDFDNPLHLCGISLGAVLALHYAIDNPTHIHSLLLIAPQFKMPKNLLAIQSLLFFLMPKRCFKDMPIGKREIINLTNTMRHLDFSEKVKHISCPVFIVCGTQDKANKKAAVLLNREIPHSEIHFVENVGHEVNKDLPEYLANIIMKIEGEII